MGIGFKSKGKYNGTKSALNELADFLNKNNVDGEYIRSLGDSLSDNDTRRRLYTMGGRHYDDAYQVSRDKFQEHQRLVGKVKRAAYKDKLIPNPDVMILDHWDDLPKSVQDGGP